MTNDPSRTGRTDYRYLLATAVAVDGEIIARVCRLLEIEKYISCRRSITVQFMDSSGASASAQPDIYIGVHFSNFVTDRKRRVHNNSASVLKNRDGFNIFWYTSVILSSLSASKEKHVSFINEFFILFR